ncbi:YeiH family protein [Agreia bicolorata]|uniref:Membrane protein n=1 Tax=Agreia bicolorata TaxID=110935 RepID=A0ABR5CJF0_9MICO|nr:putative sulfate exporter family transporter [Agreia bicolorata]KJC65793.1 membrane protein [Agreia bicolorata]
MTRSTLPDWLPGMLVAACAAGIAFLLHLAFPVLPLLTVAVALGMIVAQIPALRPLLDGPLKAGLSLSARRLLRIGIVLLGLKLSLVDIAGLGVVTIIAIVLVVILTFGVTLLLGRMLGLPGYQPLLIAAGFSICGASAVGAMSAVTRAKDSESATPIALVTLCGTLAIALLPLARIPLGFDAAEFGTWVGLSVHDVGQVVATAQIAGPVALAAAVVVKLTRVLTLAPMVAIVGAVERRRTPLSSSSAVDAGTTKRPPIVPLFVLGFLAAVLVRTVVPLPGGVLEVADVLQTALLATALFALGTGIRFTELARTGWKALIVGLGSWVFIAALSVVAVWVTTRS